MNEVVRWMKGVGGEAGKIASGKRFALTGAESQDGDSAGQGHHVFSAKLVTFAPEDPLGLAGMRHWRKLSLRENYRSIEQLVVEKLRFIRGSSALNRQTHPKYLSTMLELNRALLLGHQPNSGQVAEFRDLPSKFSAALPSPKILSKPIDRGALVLNFFSPPRAAQFTEIILP